MAGITIQINVGNYNAYFLMELIFIHVQ